MSAAGAVLVERRRHRCVLAVVCNDLVLDARVLDGLQLAAWPRSGGRTTMAGQTGSGAYAFHGLPGMGPIELPGDDDTTLEPRGFGIEVVDRRGRFVDTVLAVDVPRDGLVTQLDLFDGPGDGALDGLPVHLFSAPQRALPGHVEVVRASVADRHSGVPVPWCRVTVTVDPDGLARRASGVADARGEVVVVIPAPRRTGADRSWPVTVGVHHDEALLAWDQDPAPTSRLRPGAPLPPALDRVLAQGRAQVWPSLDGPGLPALHEALLEGVDLVLRTAGDPHARLLIEGASA